MEHQITMKLKATQVELDTILGPANGEFNKIWPASNTVFDFMYEMLDEQDECGAWERGEEDLDSACVCDAGTCHIRAALEYVDLALGAYTRLAIRYRYVSDRIAEEKDSN